MKKPVKAESPRALRDFLCILICWSIPVLLLRPFQNLPFVDDWVYAWSVERLLNSGELKILDISTSANPVQILWGALFCLPAGFSFVALRISTWVASVICLWGLYQLLRILGVGRAQSFIGTAALACYPVFFILSFTFMTDVPFLALFVWSSYSLIRYLNDKRPLWLIASTLLACLAVAVRLTGLPLIAASAITLIRNWRFLPNRRLAFFLAVAPIVFLVALLKWHSLHIEIRSDPSLIANSPAYRVAALKTGLIYLHKWVLVSLQDYIPILGIALACLAIGCFQMRNLRRTLLMFAFSLALGFIYPLFQLKYATPLRQNEIWALRELGATQHLSSGYSAPIVRAWIPPLLLVIALASMAIVLAAIVRKSFTTAQETQVWLIIFQLLMMSALWLWFDRYGLPLLVPVLALLLSVAPMVRTRLTVALLSIMGVIGIVGVRDHLEYNRALWSGVESLRAEGIAASQISGGYVVNGWLQYAHSENALRNKKGDVVVPWVNASEAGAGYHVTNGPEAGWRIVREIRFKQWIGRSGSIYVLSR